LLIFGTANLVGKLLGRVFWLPLFMTAVYFLSFGVDSGKVQFPLDNWTEWLAIVYGLGWLIIAIKLYPGQKIQAQQYHA
jgi:hypothetical protein